MANQTVTTAVNQSLPMAMVIYTITHRETGKVYVGQSRGDVRRRWGTHCSEKSGAGRSAIKCAILKYGRAAFDFAVVDHAIALDELKRKEQDWIAALSSMAPNGYNLTTGGESCVYSEESKRKMSEAKKALFDKIGRKGRPVWVKKKRRPWTEEEKELRRQKMLGYMHSDEAKGKIAASKMRPVVRSDGQVFPSIEAAASSIGRNTSTLWRVVQGNRGRHTCGGFGWKYAEAQ
jgi:group I intron endonuclease